MQHLKHLAIVASLSLLFAACGKAVPQKPKETVSLPVLIDEANKGDKEAQFELGAIYHDGQGGLPKDYAKAKEYFEKAAAQGETRSIFNLGVMYYTGEGVKQNYAKAKEFFEKAAATGNARAQFNLGVMYYRGEGVKKDDKRAMEYFSSAAMQGFDQAQFNIGVMYAKGEGVPANIAQAYAWFTVARDNGNPGAAEPIGNIERQLKPEDLKLVRDLAKQLKAEIAAKATAVSSSAGVVK